MTKITYSVGELIADLNSHISKLDALIVAARGGNRKHTLGQVRECLLFSRQKLLYQLNGLEDIAEEVEPITRRSFDDLKKAIEAKKAKDDERSHED